ncbi:unnamed protein product, partial [Rotaria magnacalcarata]
HEAQHDDWNNSWNKIKGKYVEIVPIFEALKMSIKQINQNDISLSLINIKEEDSRQNLDQLEPSFMYTQIFKEVLFETDPTELNKEDFVQFWRNEAKHNNITLEIIDEFDRDYCLQSTIWWYTRQSFIYEMLNWSLRKLDSRIMMKMGFFIRDLHYQIVELHKQQVKNDQIDPLIVYRGQGLSTNDFEKIQKNQGGLMSFNNFLSTSKDQDTSRGFAESNSSRSDTVGVLFQISVHLMAFSTPFGSVAHLSNFKSEEEILFSMHTVFRVGEIKQEFTGSPVWTIQLTLTDNNDPQLAAITQCMREETQGSTDGIGLSSSNHNDRAHNYHMLGMLKFEQGEYKEAALFYEKSLEVKRKTLPQDHSSLATTYSNIGGLYGTIGDYSKALEYYNKAYKIQETVLPPNHSDLAFSCNNIALLYKDMGDYSKALEFYNKAHTIKEIAMPPNHPSLATSYSNIGAVYNDTGDYSKALEFYTKSLKISETTLPPEHPFLAISYNNIGQVHKNMGDYSSALGFYTKSHKILEIALPQNHPHLATSYSSIGAVHDNMGDYSKALEFYNESLKIRQTALPPNHPSLALSYNNIGVLYHTMGDYSRALKFYNESL